MSNVTLYRHPLSGHSHRVELLLSVLGVDANIVDVDLLSGAQKTPEFLKKNPSGQVPVLEVDGEYFTDSNAILVYVASMFDKARTWLPTDLKVASDVQKFLTLAAGQVAYGPAAARLVTVFGAGFNHQQAIEIAHKVLAHLDQHLAGREWLASDHVTIADIANYAYIAHAPEGNVSLEDYPNIHAWLKRIEALPGFVPMQHTAAGLAA